MPKSKSAKAPAKAAKAAKPRKAKKPAEEHDELDVRERRTAEKVMQAVLAEQNAEATVERLDQWVSIECPHCGEGGEVHVTAESDGQSLDQDCSVCCRTFIAHIEIDEGEAHVGIEAA